MAVVLRCSAAALSASHKDFGNLKLIDSRSIFTISTLMEIQPYRYFKARGAQLTDISHLCNCKHKKECKLLTLCFLLEFTCLILTKTEEKSIALRMLRSDFRLCSLNSNTPLFNLKITQTFNRIDSDLITLP